MFPYPCLLSRSISVTVRPGGLCGAQVLDGTVPLVKHNRFGLETLGLLAQLMELTTYCSDCALAHARCSTIYALHLSHHVLTPHGA